MSRLDRFYSYMQNSIRVKRLENEIKAISDNLKTTNELIESLESEIVIDIMSEFYNKMNMKLVQLQLQKNELEKEMLEYELVMCVAE